MELCVTIKWMIKTDALKNVLGQRSILVPETGIKCFECNYLSMIFFEWFSLREQVQGLLKHAR